MLTGTPHPFSSLMLRSCCILLILCASGPACLGQSYRIHVEWIDSSREAALPQVRQVFSSQGECLDYISHLEQQLAGQGYVSASIDRITWDSSQVNLVLYSGRTYRWVRLRPGNLPAGLLDAAGFHEKLFDGKLLDFVQVGAVMDRILVYCEDNGYPFARVRLDSVRFLGSGVSAVLRLDKGFLFTVDSIGVEGNAKIARSYLQNYLGIHPGSLYDESRLRTISQHIAELSFLKESKPWEIYFDGTRATLRLYLDIRKANQFDFLVGFLPKSQATGGLLLTGQAALNLQNAFGRGEGITLNWQQLQYKSPQLDLAFQYPYLSHSPFGINFAFDLLRKDSSWLNINAMAGIQYQVRATEFFRFSLQQKESELLTVDTLQVKETHQLPSMLDLSSTQVAVRYEIDHTDYQLNPRRGFQFNFSVAAGTRTIHPNPGILQLQDTGSSPFRYSSLYDTLPLKSYQATLLGRLARFFPLGSRSVLETALQGGALIGPDLLVNELFQIGGYSLLRGFDEQSIYASQYAVLTLEYRYLLGLNSYFFVFSDNGYVQMKYLHGDSRNGPWGLGAGISFQSGNGIFNISWAVGRQQGQPFNLRESKIHFGYLNFF